MPSQTPIFLLKTRSSPHDGYDDFLNAQGYNPSFIPVLEHRFNSKNLAQVRDLFASGAFELNDANANANTQNDSEGQSKKYGGMIFTSQRAVEGFAEMIEQDGLPLPSTPLVLYTVGPATARTLTTLRDKHIPSAKIYGADAGTGEKLAHLMLEHYNDLHPSTPESLSSNKAKPGLLFLVGEQRRDIIPKTLMSDSLPAQDRIPVHEIVVYETGEMESFEKDFESAVTFAQKDKQIEPWVVVFSPSGCEAMLRVLGLGPFKSDGNEDRGVFVATIGPTTRDYLRNTFGFEADVCAEKPSPEGVVEGIRRFMELRKSA
ncbi:Tetrapyrrole biosynthesis uroporphyrinogen III synthase [Penicillium frequentans]|nr:Tetrapyrrole biosynthesis uroporphyrinogen III synthase [Penicillium glabrum]